MSEVFQRIAARIKQNRKGVGPTGFPFEARPPASVQDVEATERRLGFALPPLLRQLYLEVANGGFGPGYGIMGAEGGFTDDLGHTVADLYTAYRQPDPEDAAWLWPTGHLPICHWGCAVYSVLACDREGPPVYFLDPSAKEPGEPMSTIVKPHKASLEEWLRDWLNVKDLWRQVWGSER